MNLLRRYGKKVSLEPMRFKRIFTAIIYTSIDLITRASLTGFSDGVKSFSLQLKKVFFSCFFGMVIFCQNESGRVS